MLVFFILSWALEITTLEKMLGLVNLIRLQHGRQPLRLSKQLCAAAQRYSEVQASKDIMGHSVDGSSFVDRIRAQNYPGNPTAENVGEGYSSVTAVVQGWHDSPGHFANMIASNSNEVGLGLATSRKGNKYWTQDFGNGHSSSYGTPAPKPKYYAPKPKYHAPKPKYHAPKPKYHAPKPKYHAPKPKYHAPKPKYQAPVTGVRSGYKKPVTYVTPKAPMYKAPKVGDNNSTYIYSSSSISMPTVLILSIFSAF
eukprot:NODE_897_length_3326_cov_0.272699.p3 type:complete len:253 gc:universal NODE_897_length_3326_cov_0.272699:1865-1107(-)